MLALLARSGPSASRDIPDTCVVPWASSGWTNTRNVTQMLEFLMMRGEVAIAGRVGRERAVGPRRARLPGGRRRPVGRRGAAGDGRAAALRARDRAQPRPPRCRSSRSTWARRASRRWSRASKGEWRVDPAALGEPTSRAGQRCSRPSTGSSTTAARALELFEFEYTLEMYKPEAKRRWGYFALPVLHEDRLVGKVDAAADRKASVAPRARDPRGRAVHTRDQRASGGSSTTSRRGSASTRRVTVGAPVSACSVRIRRRTKPGRIYQAKGYRHER